MSTLTLLGICGSLRKKSLNAALLRTVAETLPPLARVLRLPVLGWPVPVVAIWVLVDTVPVT